MRLIYMYCTENGYGWGMQLKHTQPSTFPHQSDDNLTVGHLRYLSGSQ